MSRIGDAFWRLLIDDKGLKKDAEKSGAMAGKAAGGEAGKGITGSLKKAFSGGGLKQGLLQGLGIGAALGGVQALTAGVGVLSDQIFKSIDAASDLNEAVSKSDAVFGDSSDEIQDWADTASDAFGQSKRQALEAAGTFGNLIQAFGIGTDKAAEMSKSLVELASDLASFNNTSVDDAILALRSGLSGEAEPLKRYGVAINDVRLKQEAMRLGLIKTATGTLPVAIKTQAAYSLILKDTALAQGDFERTSDGLANTQKTLQAKFEDVQAEIGQRLLPAMLALANFAKDDLMPALEDIGPVLDEIGKAIGDMESQLNFLSDSTNDAGQDISKFFSDITSWIPRFSMKPVVKEVNQTAASTASLARAAALRGEEIEDSYSDVGTAAGDMGDAVATGAGKAKQSFREMVDAAVADAKSLVSDVFDPVQRRQELWALAAEETAQRRILASKDASSVEKREATAALTQIAEDNLKLRVEMLAAGELNKKEQAKLFADLERRLKTSTGKAKGDIQDLINKLKQLGGMSVRPKITVGYAGHAPGTGPLMAEGGPVQANKPYVVGDAGVPELFVPSQSGYIHPTVAEGLAAVGAPGGNTYNVTLLDKTPVYSVRDIGSSLRMLEDQGYLPGVR